MQITRRGLLKYSVRYGAAIAIGSTVGRVITRQPSEFDIVLKDNDPEKRQAYLNRLYTTLPRPNGLKEIDYFPRQDRKPDGGYYEMTTYNKNGFFTESSNEITVQVYPLAFVSFRPLLRYFDQQSLDDSAIYPSEQEFLSSLRHEYRHVRQANGELLASIPPNVIDELRKSRRLNDIFVELDAYFNQIVEFENMNFRDGVQVSQRFRTRTYSWYRFIRNGIQNLMGVTPATLWIMENYPDLPERPREVLPKGF